MHARAYRLEARRGSTMVEMIVSLSLGSVVLAVVFGSVIIMQRQHRTLRERQTGEDAMRVAELVLRMVVQGAGADPMASGQAGLDPVALTGGKGSEIRVKSDFNPADADVGDLLEDVSIKVLADSLMVRWNATGSWQTLVYPVRSITFEYFDETLAPVTAAAAVATAIAVRFTIAAPEHPKSQVVRSRQTWVYLQNRR